MNLKPDGEVERDRSTRFALAQCFAAFALFSFLQSCGPDRAAESTELAVSEIGVPSQVVDVEALHEVVLRRDGSGAVDGVKFSSGSFDELRRLLASILVLGDAHRSLIPKSRVSSTPTFHVVVPADAEFGSVAPTISVLLDEVGRTNGGGSALRLRVSAADGSQRDFPIPLSADDSLPEPTASSTVIQLFVVCDSRPGAATTAKQNWSFTGVDSDDPGAKDRDAHDVSIDVALERAKKLLPGSSGVLLVRLEPSVAWQQVVDTIASTIAVAPQSVRIFHIE